MKQLQALILAIILAVSSFSILLYRSTLTEAVRNDPFYVGVTFQGDTVAEAKLLIDRVKGYTNLFVLGLTPVSRNETETDEVCDYAASQGLNIIVNFGYYDQFASAPDEAFRRWPWQHSWVLGAKQKYGNRFLGVYYDDEPAGINLDYNWIQFFVNYSSYLSRPLNTTLHEIYAKFLEAHVSGTTPDNYDLEAEYFQSLLNSTFSHTGSTPPEVTTFTSDYVLYWFDYLGGYDVIFAQLGWNQSVVQDIALVKGAARLQNKDWGTIITWKYNATPYLDSGAEVYKQLVASYRAGAKYTLIFNYPLLEGNAYGVMRDEHFLALEEFWKNFMSPEPKSPDLSGPEAVLVLPRNYGWGMRNPDDGIWGIWGPDGKSPQVWRITQSLLGKYGLQLDIVYDDPAFAVTGKYNQIYYWNYTG